MHIAYTTTFDTRDVHNWSGTPHYMAKSFSETGADVSYIGPLERRLPPFFKIKQVWNKNISGQRESPRFNIFAAKHYSAQVATHLKNSSADVVISPLVNPIAYLECKQPIVLWTDALYAALIGFYSPFSAHSASSVAQGNQVTAECLSRCQLAIFSSDWAANSALQLYGVEREKVHVVPFGANINTYPSLSEMQDIIKNRSSKTIKLLFLAKSWERKGGDVVLAVAKALHEAGHPVELTIVGYYPPNLKPLPVYVKCLGFVSKHTEEGSKKIQSLLAETHFLFVPSRAEAYGIVFCEANAFGVPCLTTYVGGIGTVVKDNINGMTFALEASVSTYCDYIVQLMHDRSRYNALALSSYHEYETRLNWKVAIAEVKQLVNERQ